MSSPDMIVHWPFGPADVQAKAYAAVIAAEIVNDKTELTIAQMTGNATLNLTASDRLGRCARITIKVSVDGTNRTLTPGTKMAGLAQVLTANKSYVLEYEWDGTAYKHCGTQIQN